jgi:FMN-dependent NADH-azoreductase
MHRILHIVGSPRTNLSASKEVADAFIDEVVRRRPDVTVDVLDVWQHELPEFDEHVMNAKYAHLTGVALTPRQEHAWATLAPLAERIRAADVVVVSVPMWNFGIPYRLKMFIDLVSQRDDLFRFDGVNFSGMASGTALVVSARGINYSTGSSTPEAEFDFQKSYMTMWLNLIGIKEVEHIVLEQLLFGSEKDAQARASAKASATAAAARYLRDDTHVLLESHSNG